MVPPQPDSGSSGCAPATTTLSRCAVLPAFSPFACPASRGRPAAAATICDDRPSISRRVICFTSCSRHPCLLTRAARQYSPREDTRGDLNARILTLKLLQPLAAIRLLSHVEESIECSVSWVFFGPFPMPAKP